MWRQIIYVTIFYAVNIHNVYLQYMNKKMFIPAWMWLLWLKKLKIFEQKHQEETRFKDFPQVKRENEAKTKQNFPKCLTDSLKDVTLGNFQNLQRWQKKNLQPLTVIEWPQARYNLVPLANYLNVVHDRSNIYYGACTDRNSNVGSGRFSLFLD